MKILILGIGQSNFLNQLYGEIQKVDSVFKFNIDGYFDISNGKVDNNNTIYENYYNFSRLKIPKLRLLFLLVKFFFTKLFWQVLLFELSQKSNFKHIKNKIISLTRKKYIYKKQIKPLNFDVLHFHFCAPQNLEYLYFLPKKAQVICSFWGSDLYRNTGVQNVYYVSKALERANFITVQSPEMAMVVKSKYGLDLDDKITDVRFTLSTEIYENINKTQNEKGVLDIFKEKYNIDKAKLVVALGHNAYEANNHIPIIEQMKKLPANLKNGIVFLLHLSYGGNELYKNKLKKTISETRDLQFIIIEDYFNPLEIAKLRLITDVLIQVPISDALSGAMTEVLYAGNSVIAGGWLPYGILRRNGIEFQEIEKWEELPFKLEEVLSQDSNDIQTNNVKSIESFLFPNTTTKDWISLFNKLQ